MYTSHFKHLLGVTKSKLNYTKIMNKFIKNNRKVTEDCKKTKHKHCPKLD